MKRNTLEVYSHVYAGNRKNRFSGLAICTWLVLVGTLFITFNIQAASFSTDIKQFAWFYKPPYDTSLSTLVRYFDNYTLTVGDEKTRDSLQSLGVYAPFLEYLRFDAIQDPNSCTSTPARNQVAYKAGDFCSISKYHPDWFMLDTYGKRIYDSGYVFMDPDNSGWRSFFVTRAKELQSKYGWNGVLLDNVEGSLGKRKQTGHMPQKYTSDSSYQSAINGMLAYLYNNYFHPYGHPLIANIISMRSWSIWFTYLNSLTGAMTEAWAVGWHNDYETASQWLSDMQAAQKTQSLGKRAILVSQGDQSNTSLQQFTYASYLLISNGKAAFRYAKKNYYRYAWIYSNYSKDPGTPLGSMYQSGSQFCRDFSRGKVCVNPGAHSSSINTW